MRVVIDTNILVSAAIADRNPEAVILFLVANPEFEWVVSAEILDEYKGVLSRSRLRLTQEQKERWFNLLDEATILTEVNVDVDFPRDQKDAKFLACAMAADANFLITGDRDFSEVQTLGNTTIISVSLFKRLVCDV
ncbi:MAG: putative toxin-antitoxin system toxin component, PIN family [Coleofasciculaceae cyanobacterium]